MIRLDLEAIRARAAGTVASPLRQGRRDTPANEDALALLAYVHDLKQELAENDRLQADLAYRASAAYRRGADAMRLACQQWCRAWENDGNAIADALADLRVEDEP